MANNVINIPTVKALYSYKGAHNDELTFKKGDVIALTQKVEGGWWEGTLGDTTGWFPANYVIEHNEPVQMQRGIEDSQACRLIVTKDLHDSEKAHVIELQGLYTNFLLPLECSQIITPDEFSQLIGNFKEVLFLHDKLLCEIQKPCGTTSPYSDRIGKIFLDIAPKFKLVHMAYCANHPRAVVIIDKYKDELNTFMEHSGAASPGILVLITGLSKPFRRLPKYSAMLQELERHLEISHPDRGDTQRGVAVYKDIDHICSATRKQKELQLQVLTGPIRDWQGQPVTSLGEIVHMSCVSVGADQKDRFFVLFPTTLLILSVSQRMSAFIYEGKLPLGGIMVCRVEDSELYKNVFEIDGPLIEKIIVTCKTSTEADKWVELLMRNGSSLKRPSTNSFTSVVPKPPYTPAMPQNNPINRSFNPATSPDLTMNHQRSHSFNHHQSYMQHTNTKPAISNNNKSSGWNMTNARPHPPSNFVNPEWQQPNKIEDDSQILSVLEAYYAANNNIATKNNPPKAVDFDLNLKGKDNVPADHVCSKQRRGQSFNNHQRVFNINQASCSNNTKDFTHRYSNSNYNPSSARYGPNTLFYNPMHMSAFRECKAVPIHTSHPTLTACEPKIKTDSIHRSNPNINEVNFDYNFTPRRYSIRNEAYNSKRATSWCCGSFVKKQLKKTKHYD